MLIYEDSKGADRKSTRLNSSHMSSSYAVFCLKKKTTCQCVARDGGACGCTHSLPHLSACRHGRDLFFFNQTATTEIYTLSLHDALPIWRRLRTRRPKLGSTLPVGSVRIKCTAWKIGRAVQQECRDRSRMPSSA